MGNSSRDETRRDESLSRTPSHVPHPEDLCTFSIANFPLNVAIHGGQEQETVRIGRTFIFSCLFLNNSEGSKKNIMGKSPI